MGRASRRLAGDAARDRVPAADAARPRSPPTGPSSGPRARCSRARRRRSRARSTPRAGAGRWSCSPTWPASTARRSRCASGSSSSAPRSAERSSTSTDRSCSASSRATTAARSWSSRNGSTRKLETVALEGAYASVIGGAPAAGVVFAREVEQAARQDARITELDAHIEIAEGVARPALRAAAHRAVGRGRGREATGRSRLSSTGSTASSALCGWARCGGPSPPPRCGRILIDAVERGIDSAVEPGSPTERPRASRRKPGRPRRRSPEAR